MNFITFIIFTLFSFVGLCVGFFLVKKPAMAIEIQRRFYAKINWRIEPISMQKELRNTRIMGWIVIILILATLSYSSKVVILLLNFIPTTDFS